MKLFINLHNLLYTGCVFIILSCSTGNPVEKSLTPVNEYDLLIPEPSGLSFGSNYESLWVVSDRPKEGIYQISLDGKIIQKLDYEGNDLEGISYDFSDNTVWVVEEQQKEIIKLTLDGTVLIRQKLDISLDANYGLEGISVADSQYLWVTNEKNPGAIFRINLNSYKSETQKIFDFVKDYSGLCYDADSGNLWLVSDESELLVRWNVLDNQSERFSIPVKKAEGVAYRPSDNSIFIVSDAEGRLYHFALD